ncbi:hypothetical protein CEN49_26170 [Fischerella thermalis CCMEE 5273]|nr:hypothetical protein CEN49_26170 [Fischerella thermalis CCMEE 5273]
MKPHRMGTVTAGMVLIFMGVLLLGHLYGNWPVWQWITTAWPVVLILLGIEILVYRWRHKEEPLRFHGGSIGLLIIVLITSILLYPLLFLGNWVMGNPVPKETVTVEESWTIPDDVEEVIVEIPNGHVTMTGVEENQAHVSGSLQLHQMENNPPPIKMEIVGKEARIRLEDDSQGWFLFPAPMVFADLQLELPIDRPLSVRVHNGSLEVAEIKADLSINHHNGKLLVQRIDGGVTIDHANGNIRLENITGPVTADSSNGKVTVTDVRDRLNLSNANGSLDVQSRSIEGDWRVETSNGQIRIRIEETPDASIYTDHSVGQLGGNIPWEDGRATLGSGKHRVELETHLGNIRVDVDE